MSSYLIALHRCHVLLVIYISLPVLFPSPVDSELGGDHHYLDDPTPYPTEEGKRSPTSLIPVLQSILLACVQLYFAAPIVACGKCLHFLSTAPSLTCLAYCALLELFLLICLAAIIYGRGIIPGGKYLISEYWRWK